MTGKCLKTNFCKRLYMSFEDFGVARLFCSSSSAVFLNRIIISSDKISISTPLVRKTFMRLLMVSARGEIVIDSIRAIVGLEIAAFIAKSFCDQANAVLTARNTSAIWVLNDKVY